MKMRRWRQKGEGMNTPKSISVVLNEQERKALYVTAEAECRRPQDQLRHLLRVSLGLARETQLQLIHNRDHTPPAVPECDEPSAHGVTHATAD
jgi:hypothetical protein